MLKRKYNKRKVIKSDGQCVYCNSKDNLTLEHIVPRRYRKAYGLHRSEIDSPGNLAAACETCNSKKGCRSPDDFFNDHPLYRESLLKNATNLSPKLRRIIDNNNV